MSKVPQMLESFKDKSEWWDKHLLMLISKEKELRRELDEERSEKEALREELSFMRTKSSPDSPEKRLWEQRERFEKQLD